MGALHGVIMDRLLFAIQPFLAAIQPRVLDPAGHKAIDGVCACLGALMRGGTDVDSAIEYIETTLEVLE